MPSVKKCTKCGFVKPLTKFAVNKRNKTDGRQPKCKTCNKAYYEANRDKVQRRVKKRYEENHEDILERRRELAQRPEAKVKKAEQDKAYYLKNKEKISDYYKNWAKANKEHLRAYWKQWYHDNLEHARMQSRVSSHRRLERVVENGNNTLTLKEIEKLLDKHPFCAYCGESDKKLTIDHIIPLAKGGQNCIENINIACMSCNLSKGDKLLSEWEGFQR